MGFRRSILRAEGTAARLLTRRRVAAYSFILFGAFTVFLLWGMVSGQILPVGRELLVRASLIAADQPPARQDFATYYAASRLLRGDAAAVYDHGRLLAEEKAVERELAGQPALALDDWTVNPWQYPPIHFFAVYPLAWFPYAVAGFVWLLATGAVYVVGVRMLVPGAAAVGLALAFPAVVANGFLGQNGLLTAGLMALALAFLDRRPLLAGLFFGLLAYKPHFGLLVPLALGVAGRWRAMGAAAAAVALQVAASALVFGWEAWQAYLPRVAYAFRFLASGQVPEAMQATVFGAVRVLGGDAAAASAAQSVSTALAAALVAWVWWRTRGMGGEGGRRLSAAALCLGALLATPQALNYDLTLMGLALLLLAQDAARRGWLAGELSVFAVAFWLPLFGPALVKWLGLPTAPVVLFALTGLLVRRLRRFDPVHRPARVSGVTAAGG